MSSSMLTGLVFLVMSLFLNPSTCLVYPSIQWTPRNPMFQKPERSRVINVQSMSRINIICPNTATNVGIVQSNTPKEWLYENFWIVSKNSYDNCNASSKTDRLLLRCDKPLNLKYTTIYFLQYSATTNGLEFPIGKEYYFIATSDGTKASLNNRAGGNCARGSMKMKFYVCKGLGDPRCQPTASKITQSSNQITNIPTTTSSTSSKHIKTKHKTTDTNSIQIVKPSPRPTQIKYITTEKNKALQSDDPRMTLHPTISSHRSTVFVPETTTAVKPDTNKIELLPNRDTCMPCTHDHGTQPSWNVVIPLLVVIFILVIMNSFIICRLKQNNKSCLDEDNLNHVPRSEKKYNFKNNNRNAPPDSPVMV